MDLFILWFWYFTGIIGWSIILEALTVTPDLKLLSSAVPNSAFMTMSIAAHSLSLNSFCKLKLKKGAKDSRASKKTMTPFD